MEISAILYSIIDQIGKEKIQRDLTSDIQLSKRYIEMIFDKCEKHIEGGDEETIGTLFEALLHFMLTVSTLPSTRKVRINNTVLDIIIPNFHMLKSSPNKSLLIQIAKETNDINQGKIKTVARFQPDDKNLWVISKNPLSIGCINYTFYPGEKAISSRERRDYSDIIVDIHKFLEQTGDKSLRFFQS